jgi:hypothetical protein
MSELTAAFEAEFSARGIPLKPGAANRIIRDRINEVANQAGLTPRTAMKHLTIDGIRDIARNTARALKEREAAEDALSAVALTIEQAGLIISAFTVAARLGVVNGDPDVAADLCEVVAGVGIEMCSAAELQVSARLLRDGLRWAELPTEQLTGGAWSVLPGRSKLRDDAGVAARLQGDLEEIRSLLYFGSQ